jgi:hypothetical protein
MGATVSVEADASWNAADSAAADPALLALDWTPSLQVRVGGWTWRVDPEDRLSPADADREARERERQVVRALAMAPILLG